MAKAKTTSNIVALQTAADAALASVKTSRRTPKDPKAAKRKRDSRARAKTAAAVAAAIESQRKATVSQPAAVTSAESGVTSMVSEKSESRVGHVGRIVSAILGAITGGLNAYAAFEFGLKLEGGAVSYIALAAPVVALTAGLLPPLAERAWAAGGRVKSLALWCALVPCAAVAFYSAAERVHLSKAGAETERAALRYVVDRATVTLDTANAEAAAATLAANKVRGLTEKTCGPKCQSVRATETAARGRVTEAESNLEKAQGKAIQEANLKPPVWLLPVALDFASFVLLWSAFGAPSRRPRD